MSKQAAQTWGEGKAVQYYYNLSKMSILGRSLTIVERIDWR